jgi:hypothetical protein
MLAFQLARARSSSATSLRSGSISTEATGSLASPALSADSGPLPFRVCDDCLPKKEKEKES